MKKISKVLFLWGIVVVLAACGRGANSAGDLAQDINIGTGRAGNGEKDDDRENGGAEQESDAPEQEKSEGEEGAFSFLYEGATLTPGEIFDPSVNGGYKEVSEVPSCAFEGSDRVYNYEAFELTAYIGEDGEHIYSIYFMDSNLPTTEGLHLGDTVDDMKSLYGEAYEAEGTAYTYKRGETLLIIITRDDTVVSIEYRLDR